MGRLTEKKRILIDHDCKPNPVYLVWIGLGCWNNWLFSGTQTIGDDVESTGTFAPYVEDIETATQRQEQLSKSSIQKVVLGAEGLTLQQVNGIRTLLRSVKVYEMFTDGSKIGVLVEDGSFQVIETRESKHSIELTISYPEKYNQHQ